MWLSSLFAATPRAERRIGPPTPKPLLNSPSFVGFAFFVVRKPPPFRRRNQNRIPDLRALGVSLVFPSNAPQLPTASGSQTLIADGPRLLQAKYGISRTRIRRGAAFCNRR